MKILTFLTAAILAISSSALANGQGRALQECQAYANGVGFSGAKSGYADEYTAALNACLARQSTYVAGDFRQPRLNRGPVGVTCPPGAGPMYRGTLYCTN